VTRGKVGIIERSGRLRSNTAIDLDCPNPACRQSLHTGLTKEPRLRREAWLCHRRVCTGM